MNKELKEINFITYGGKKDDSFANDLKGINVLSTTWHNSPKWTISHLLLKYSLEIQKSDILKTNQIPGSEIPIWIKKHFNKKLIVRCGYLHSYIAKKESKDQETINTAVQLEKNAFSSADVGIVSTSWQREIILKQYNIESSKIKVIPNYVMTDIFKPHLEMKKEYDLVFIGRAGNEKNLDNLLKAIHYLKIKNKKEISLLMIGGCCYDNEIQKTVNHFALDVAFKGNILNFNLPYFLNQAKTFIFPSKYEGHPKALLEAMSCGLPCIASDVTGIKEDIDHLKTGYLCKTDYKDIANAIDTVLSDESLQKTIGKNARKYILNNYSIDRIVKMELDVIQEVIAR